MTINRTGPHWATPDRTESLTYLLTYTWPTPHLSQAQFQWSNNNDDFKPTRNERLLEFTPGRPVSGN